jgi:hypothetical protein
MSKILIGEPIKVVGNWIVFFCEATKLPYIVNLHLAKLYYEDGQLVRVEARPENVEVLDHETITTWDFPSEIIRLAKELSVPETQ